MLFAKYLREPYPERFAEEILGNGEKKRRLAIQKPDGQNLRPLICGHLYRH
jgi:hypothetical protein